MAICINGRESIEHRTVDSGPDKWIPVDTSGVMIDVDHDDHAPMPMVTVEPVTDDSEQCDSCAWLTEVARYRVAGNMLTCAEHLAATLNLAFSMLDRN